VAIGIEIVFVLLTLSGLAYLLIALWGARDFAHYWRGRRSTGISSAENFAPDVSILKPVKGSDERMYAGFVSHCVQEYGGQFEILFGVSSLEDSAVAEVERLKAEFPLVCLRLIVCPERLGSSGKVSNLVQMLREARYEHVLINDSDIFVGPHYLTRVMASFAEQKVGMVTAPYIGRALASGVNHDGGIPVWSRLEALGISTDFMPGVLTARRLEGGIRFGLGSTLATTKTVLAKIGGLESLLESLADDYEMGARIAAAGYSVELSDEVVETTVPAYTFRGFWEHQMRWARSTRDSRKWGYVGLGVTYAVPWAVATVFASGFALWSFTLLSLVLLARVAVALSVGVGILRDGQVLRDIWLLPLRDCFGLAVWAWSFAGDTVVWRGERFRLRDGRLERVWSYASGKDGDV
jgi:ceramide glucosyltransferase